MIKRFFAWLFSLPQRVTWWISSALYVLGFGQFMAVMGFAYWHTSEIRWDDAETFYGLPLWTSFLFVGASALIAIVLGIVGFFLRFSDEGGSQ